ncbi:MAG: hypothetical protein HOC27_04745 [Phycisphaerae bacterium]|nr:hypothetical protein [Phycisphaerae bacterium]
MHSKLKRTWHKITADKRRFGLFCTLLFVGLLLWARIIVIARPARTAIAEPYIETAVATILSSDNKTTKVFLESEPMKNPFSVDSEIFPLLTPSTDNTMPDGQKIEKMSENDIVRSFRLEAVMGKLAMINGQVVKIGDIVGSKTVQEPLRLIDVHGRTVIISAGARRYELSIAPLRQ